MEPIEHGADVILAISYVCNREVAVSLVIRWIYCNDWPLTAPRWQLHLYVSTYESIDLVGKSIRIVTANRRTLGPTQQGVQPIASTSVKQRYERMTPESLGETVARPPVGFVSNKKSTKAEFLYRKN